MAAEQPTCVFCSDEERAGPCFGGDRCMKESPMSDWLSPEAEEAWLNPHTCEPDATGHHCVTCGALAERVDPDELADAFAAAYKALPVKGQVSWLE